MQKIILTLLFCSVITMANSEQNNNESTDILTKTLKKVKSFKKEKNQEIKALRVEIQLLKNRFKSLKNKQKKEIKIVKAKLKMSEKRILKYKKNQVLVAKQKKEIKIVKAKLKMSEKRILKYKKAQVKANKVHQKDKKIIKDLHFIIKHKNEAVMDEYALGRYYFNL